MIRRLCIWIVCFWTALCWAAALSPVDELEHFLASLTTLSCTFRQEVIDESGQVSQQSQGEFQLRRPGKFRWIYMTPFRQEIIGDGMRVWFYDPDLEQVTVRKLDAALGSSAPALLLSGRVKLADRFLVKEQGRRGGRSWVELRPKSEDDIFRRLRVELEGGRLVSMELADRFGHLTRISFQEVILNPPLDDERFRFTPPPAVDVFVDG